MVPEPIFDEFVRCLDNADVVSVPDDKLWADRRVNERASVLKRSKFYIDKEVRSLRELEAAGKMSSKIEVRREDDDGRPCASISFSLGDETGGYTRYLYTVYRQEDSYWCPKFSFAELVKFALA